MWIALEEGPKSFNAIHASDILKSIIRMDMVGLPLDSNPVSVDTHYCLKIQLEVSTGRFDLIFVCSSLPTTIDQIINIR